MLLNTNTINFEELRSETQRSEREGTLYEDRVRQITNFTSAVN